jgi:hypothetical protein
VIAPHQWVAWFAQISSEVNTAPNMIPIPLVVRLAVAALLIAYAARTGRAWILAPAVALSLPLLWFHGLAILVAITPLLRASRSEHSAIASDAV